METLGTVLVVLVALIHVYIVVLEMFLWTGSQGRRTFRNTVEFAEATKVMAANQGLYNGFLAAGLFVGVLAAGDVQLSFRVFFLSCVIVAGLYGAATVSRRILMVQSVPAAAALIVTLIAR